MASSDESRSSSQSLPAATSTDIGRRKWLTSMLAGPAIVTLPRTAVAWGSITTCAYNYNQVQNVKLFLMEGETEMHEYARVWDFGKWIFQGSPTNIKEKRCLIETSTGEHLDCDYNPYYMKSNLKGFTDIYGVDWKYDPLMPEPMVKKLVVGVVNDDGTWMEADFGYPDALPLTGSCYASIGHVFK